MRRRLVTVFVAISTLVALAFALPLALLISRTAEDRALDAARADVAAVTPVLASGGTDAQVAIAVGFTDAGRDGRMTVVDRDGLVAGVDVASDRLTEATVSGRSAVGSVPGGKEVVGSVVGGDGELSAVRVFVSDAALHRGRTAAWMTLAAVTAILVAIAVVTADRLARDIVRPTERLAGVARRLGAGDLAARVEPAGPAELEELGTEVNRLGSRVAAMLEHERELIAELSHRLRTPLTTLRLRVDQVDDDTLADQLRGDVDALTAEVTAIIEEARGPRAVATRTDAVEVVRARARHWSVLAEDQDRAWELRLPDHAAIVALPATELAAAVDALIENLFSHTPEGAPVRIVVAVADTVDISVEDGGPGLAPGSVAPGVSGGASTGLGLAIATRAAHAAGGSLEVGTSDLGGAAVTLRLPPAAPSR